MTGPSKPDTTDIWKDFNFGGQVKTADTTDIWADFFAPDEFVATTAKKKRAGDLRAGFQAGLQQLPSSVGSFLKTVGLEELGETLIEKAGEPDTEGRITSLKQIKSLGDVADYVQYSLGSGVAQLLPSVAGAAGGTALGGPIGGIIGAIAPSYILNVGSVQAELEKMGAEDRKGLALALGVPIAALDVITPTDLANRIVAKQVAKGTLARMGKGALKEAGTEAAQEEIQYFGTRGATGQPVGAGEAIERGLEAGVQGGLVGGVAGLPGRSPTAQQRKTQQAMAVAPTPEQITEREAKIAAMEVQGKETEEKQKSARVDAMRTANAWNMLNAEQRQKIFPGIGDADYDRDWSKLSDDAKKVVKETVKERLEKVNAPPPTAAPAPTPAPAQPEQGAPVQVAPQAPSPAASQVAAEVQQTVQPLIDAQQRLVDAGLPPDPDVQKDIDKYQGQIKGLTAPTTEVAPPAAEPKREKAPKGPKAAPEPKTEGIQIGIPSGDPYAHKKDPSYIPTVEVIKFAKAVVGDKELEQRIRSRLGKDESAMSEALMTEQVSREVLRTEYEKRGAAARTAKKKADAQLLKDLEKEIIYQDPTRLAGTAQQVMNLPEAERAKLDTVHDALVDKHKSGTLTAAERTLLKNLDALNQAAFQINEGTPIDKPYVSPYDQVEQARPERAAGKEGILEKVPKSAEERLKAAIEEALKPIDKAYMDTQNDGELLAIYRGHLQTVDLVNNRGAKIENIAGIIQDIFVIDQELTRRGIDHEPPRWVQPATPSEPQAATTAETPAPSISEPPTIPEGVEGAGPTATIEELDAAIDAVDQARTEGVMTDKQANEALMEIGREKSKHPRPAEAPVGKFPMPDTIGKDLNTLTPEQISNTMRSIASLLRNPDIMRMQQSAVLRSELDRLLDFEAKKRLNSNEAGYLMMPFGKRQTIKKLPKEQLSSSEEYFSNRVVLEPVLKSPWSWVKVLRKLYQGTFRQSHSVNMASRLYETGTGQALPAHEHPGKLMEMMDGSITKAEIFLRGDGPFVPDDNGATVPALVPDPETGQAIQAESLAKVSEIAGGDIERLGWLWAAARALDVKANKNRNIGIDLGHAKELFLKSPQQLHDAVKAGRRYHLGVAMYGHSGGLLSAESLTKFAEETAYGPIQRVFNEKLVRTIIEQMKLTGKTPEQLLGSQPFQQLKGSELPLRNMFEASIDATYRVIRATDLNNFATTLVDLAKRAPELFRGIIQPAEHRLRISLKADSEARKQAVKAMFDEAGITISDYNANLFANLLSDDALAIEGGILRVIQPDGSIEYWQVDSMLTDAIKSLSPPEFWMITRFMGAVARPLRWGVVLDPLFIAGQTVIDQFQGWMNTNYGFIPVYDSFRGWWNLVKDSDLAKEAFRAGGVERAGLRTRTSLAEVIAGPNLPPGALAVQELQQMHPAKALNAILTPLREATRMGEYIRAREHGASPIQAAWAARDLLGNYSVEGTFPLIRALNHVSAFSRPALAAIDKTGRVFKQDPKRWFLRGSTLAVGAMLLYLANEDDDEIQRLRQTEDGNRWFFFRVNGQIYKWRKPYQEGAIFASGIEAVLDAARGEDPEAFKLWATAIKNEIAVNMLPVMGVVAAELWANKSLRTGGPIIPEREANLAGEYQEGPVSNSLDRAVGRTFGVAPAIVSHVVRGFGGYLGESATRGIAAAIDYSNTGELPPKEDMPFTQRLFARYPSYSTRPVREFYRNLEQIDEAAKTLDYVYNNRPEDIERQLTKYEQWLPLIEVYNDARQQINDLRASVNEIEDIADIGPQTKKLYRDEFLRQIIEITEVTNSIAREMRK